MSLCHFFFVEFIQRTVVNSSYDLQNVIAQGGSGPVHPGFKPIYPGLVPVYPGFETGDEVVTTYPGPGMNARDI